ncbi:nucleotidyltransferase family protein [Nitrosomonas communis]|uniref:Nucleotidyltransferase domain-containing protein n=1 Tax=Nitrosomonas communis TaxID=44574 RepID=A0A1I4JJ60_9PROT|nr:nucleotidyltransferase domain-containing protein [Nitrosomonas communis]SFL66628.1 Nucleotidyltransferase domain-containing protein [Nitrosomonas communis]
MSKQIELIDRHLAQLKRLLAIHVPEAEIWVFGSRIHGSAHEGSDLDLVLRNPNDLTTEVAGWGDLIEALQESSLPILIEVHDWAHLPVAFRDEIMRDYVVLQSVTK